jgi:hypothetical protein
LEARAACFCSAGQLPAPSFEQGVLRQLAGACEAKSRTAANREFARLSIEAIAHCPAFCARRLHDEIQARLPVIRDLDAFQFWLHALNILLS